MLFTSAEISAWIGTFLWPLVRIGAMVMAAPIFGARLVPFRIRVVVAVFITIAVMPLLPAMPKVDALSSDGILIIVQQFLIGISMGFMMQMVFAAFVLGGQVLAMSMGLGFASMNDPTTGISVPTVGQLFTIMVTLAFISLNGHLILIEVVAASFRTLPVSTTGLGLNSLWAVASWASQMFAGAVMIALPAITAMLIVNLGFAVLTRAAPQLNIFAVGFPVIITVGFIMMFLTLPVMLSHLTELTESALKLIRAIGEGRV